MATPFIYDHLEPKHIRLFQLDHSSSSDHLTGRLVVLRHPTHLDRTIENYRGMCRKWRDMNFVKKSGEAYGYDALSYTWGTQLETFPLKLQLTGKTYKDGILYSDGVVQREGITDIHRNLYDFLCRLQKAKYERFIWIDAICIDQNDDQDKSMQIPLMRYIYHEAREVKIWLGMATPIEEEALASIPDLTEKLESKPHSDDWEFEDPGRFESMGLPPPDQPVWRALGLLMTRSWFDRLWTLQEAILWEKSSVIYCGDEQISWEQLKVFVSTMNVHGLADWTLPRSVATVVGVTDGYEAISLIQKCKNWFMDADSDADWGLPLDFLLNVIRRRSVTRPADMVFAMLALMAHGEKSRITVDVSLPVERVYFEFARYYILNELDECILNHTSSHTRREGLPSWCPDFSAPETTVSLASKFHHGTELYTEQFWTGFRTGFNRNGQWAKPMVRNRQYTLIKDMPASKRLYQEGKYDLSHPDFIQVVSDLMQLNVSGVLIDKIAHVIKPTDALATRVDHWTEDNLEKIVAWDKECLSLARKTLRTGVGIPTAYWRTLIANALRVSDGGVLVSWDEHGRTDYCHAYKEFCAFIDLLIPHWATNYATSVPDLSAEVRFFLHRFIEVTRNRCFFATANGRIGIGPADTKPGDDVRVIIFCPTPYILRERGSVYEFIGEAYVDGMMYGQALEMVDQGILTKERFSIA
ncbi:MAG: hypothetical protein LQ350_003700 [Teloschistes chrysophthalmus]|nr:MAG: hypothetical protein LQ350_003700 [Niorma chrysophthalma]